MATMMRTDDPCRRGGDRIALDHLQDQEWLFRHLTPALMDWPNIEALAYGLMTTGHLNHDTIRHLMNTRPL